MAGTTILLIGVVSTTLESIKISNKSEAQSLIDQEGAWIVAQMREQILNADPEFVTCMTSNPPSLQLSSARDGGQTSYSCNTVPSPYYIASSSGTLAGSGSYTSYNLVGTNISVTDCNQFVTCTNEDFPSVTIKFTLQTGAMGGFFDTYVSKTFNEKFVVRN